MNEKKKITIYINKWPEHEIIKYEFRIGHCNTNDFFLVVEWNRLLNSLTHSLSNLFLFHLGVLVLERTHIPIFTVFFPRDIRKKEKKNYNEM